MSIYGLVVTAVLALILLIAIARPFFALPDTIDTFRNRQRERALSYYERVLSNIRDLDDDHSTGKISEDEYNAERDLWMNRGVRLLAMLDELNAAQDIIENSKADDAAIDAAIERKLARQK
jgi:hypothetical protein